VLPDLLVQQDYLVLLPLWGQQVQQVFKVLLVLRVQQDLQVQDLQVQRV
jgi:hypothetical protein